MRTTPLREKNQHKFRRKDTSFLLRAVQDRVSAKGKKEKVSGMGRMDNLPYDLIFKIFLLLPAESLHKSSFVCKTWFSIVNSSNFTEAHISQCKTVLIFLQSVPQRKPNTYSIEANLGRDSIFLPKETASSYSYINFMEVEDGKGKVSESNITGIKDILATCNGLILALCERNGGLRILNPVTGKLTSLRQGTIMKSRDESYGLMFSQLSKDYKVVHLFRDESRFIGCEILNLSKRSWHAVDGPSFVELREFAYKPVAAIGALNWLPSTHDCNFLVSLGIDDEKFHKIALPITSSINGRLVEIDGFLSFATHVTKHTVEVWILKGLHKEEWVKQHVIKSYNLNLRDLIPLSTLQYGREMVFKKYGSNSLHVYDFQDKELRKIEIDRKISHYNGSYGSMNYLPHVNSLFSWQTLGVAALS